MNLNFAPGLENWLTFLGFMVAAASALNSCEMSDHHCTRLNKCTYFESLFHKGADALTIGSELRKLFCGFDGFDIMICCPSSNMNATSVQMPYLPSHSDSEEEIYSPFDGGYANSDGIIFSSLNNDNHNYGSSAERPNPIQPVNSVTNAVSDSVEPSAPSNINNIIDNFDSFSPFNPQNKPEKPVHKPEIPERPENPVEKPQSSFSSSGFTFAPLLVITALPGHNSPHVNSSFSSSNSVIYNPSAPANSNPSSSAFSSETIQSAQSSNAVFMTEPPNQCGISNYTHSRVVGGAITQIGQYPWIAALGYRFPNISLNELQFHCAGSLVTRSHIITSAHCINPFLRIARLGEYDLSTMNDGANPIDFAIAKTIVHEQYEPDIILNDIAIVKLKRQAPVNNRIRPICLPLYDPLRTGDLTGYRPYIAGWGSTFYQGPQSNILQETQVEILATSDCERSYKPSFPTQIFDDRIICAGTGGHDSCQGDSGGPLMVAQEFTGGRKGFYYILIGLVSYGYECAKDDFPGVYTRISTFLPWVQQNLN